MTHAKELQQYVSNMWQNDPCHVPHLRPLPPPLKHSSKCLADTIFVQVQFISRLFKHSEDLCIQSNLTWRRVQKHDEFLKSLFTFFFKDIDLDNYNTTLQLLRGASPNGQLWGRRKRKLCSCLRIPRKKTQQGIIQKVNGNDNNLQSS